MKKAFPSQASFPVSGINLMIQNFGFLPSKMKIYKLQMSFIINNIFIDLENAPGVFLPTSGVDIYEIVSGLCIGSCLKGRCKKKFR